MARFRRIIKVKSKRTKHNLKNSSLESRARINRVNRENNTYVPIEEESDLIKDSIKGSAPLKVKVNNMHKHKSVINKKSLRDKKDKGSISNQIKNNLITATIAYTIALGAFTYFLSDKYLFQPNNNKNLIKIDLLEGRQLQNNIILKKLESIIGELQLKEKQYINNIENLSSNVEEKNSSVGQLQENLDKLISANLKLELDVNELKLKESQFLVTINKKDEDLKNLKSQYNVLKTDYEVSENNSAKLETELKNLKVKQSKYLSSIDKLSEKLQKVSRSEENLKEDVAKIASTNKDLKKLNNLLNNELKENKSQVSKLKVEASNKNKLAVKSQPTRMVKKDSKDYLTRLKAKIEKVSMDIQAENELIDTKRSLLSSLKLECNSGTKTAKARSCSNYNETQDELKNLERKITFMKAKKSSLNNRLSRL